MEVVSKKWLVSRLALTFACLELLVLLLLLLLLLNNIVDCISNRPSSFIPPRFPIPVNLPPRFSVLQHIVDRRFWFS